MPRRSRNFSLATAVSAFLMAGAAVLPAKADVDEAAIALCERAIANGAAAGGVPQEVLHAISLTETGRPVNGRLRPWPWAINREGKGFWFRTRDEALAFARRSVLEGRHSFDVGCFQINYRWHGHHFPSLESMFDPETSAAYAAKFLRELYAEKGAWTPAAGAYHSRTPEFANRYKDRFERIRAGLAGTVLATGAPATVPGAEPRRSRTRIASRPLVITVDRVALAAGDRSGVRVSSRSVRKAPAVAADAPILMEPRLAASLPARAAERASPPAVAEAPVLGAPRLTMSTRGHRDTGD
jgi:hypothetical protein